MCFLNMLKKENMEKIWPSQYLPWFHGVEVKSCIFLLNDQFSCAHIAHIQGAAAEMELDFEGLYRSHF